jgi:hypothetical protein
MFRPIFCAQMSLRTSYRLGMSELAVGSLVPASGAAGLAFGAWALRRGGMQVRDIARRTVAFFVLKSAVNYEGRLCVRLRAPGAPTCDRPVPDRAQRIVGASLPPIKAFGPRPRAKLCAWTTPKLDKLFPVCSPSEYRPRASEHARLAGISYDRGDRI